jgi:hypothetical protein
MFSRANTLRHDSIEGTKSKLYNLMNDTDCTHPAIVQCCLDIGIDPEELKAKDLTEFIDKGISHELSQVRWNHYEIKRKTKLETVINELISRRAANRQTPRLMETSISKEDSGYSISQNPQALTPVELWNKRKDFEAARLQHIMKVQDKLEQLELDNEKKRIEASQKIQAKIEKAEKEKADLNRQKQNKLKERDTKIQKIREQKRRELEEFEKREVKKQLQRAKNITERSERRSMSMQNSKSNISRSLVMREEEDGEMIDEKLTRFNEKLNRSMERACRYTEEKASGGYLLYCKVNKLRLYKEQKEREDEENRVKLLIEIREDLTQKEKNRNQLLNDKLNQHSNKYTIKREKAEKERTKLKEEFKMRQTALIKREKQRNKFAKQIEEGKCQSLTLWSERQMLKKFDQESNLQKQNRYKERLRDKVLSKHKKTKMFLSWMKQNKEKKQQESQIKEIELRKRRAKSADKVAKNLHSFVKPRRTRVESEDERF